MDPKAFQEVMAATMGCFLVVGIVLGLLIWVGGGYLLQHLSFHWR